jgi:hypothetical protein
VTADPNPAMEALISNTSNFIAPSRRLRKRARLLSRNPINPSVSTDKQEFRRQRTSKEGFSPWSMTSLGSLTYRPLFSKRTHLYPFYSQYAELMGTPGIYASIQDGEMKPWPEDINATDPNFTPNKAKLQFDSNLFKSC